MNTLSKMIPPKPENVTVEQAIFLKRKTAEMLEAYAGGHLTLTREEVFELADRLFNGDDNLNVLLAAEKIIEARKFHDQSTRPRYDIG